MRVFEWANLKRMVKNQLPSLTSLDRIVAVLNINASNWSVAVCDLRNKMFTYHDSSFVCGKHPYRDEFVAAMRRCLCDHAAALDTAAHVVDNFEHVVGVAHWPLRNDGTHGFTPQQENSVDCGMFALACASACGSGLPLVYGQRDMKYLRRRLTLDLLSGDGSTS